VCENAFSILYDGFLQNSTGFYVDCQYKFGRCGQIEKCCDIIQSEKNGGYAYGNNYGAKKALELNTDILFIGNPDVDVEEKDVDKILDGFKTEEYSIISGIEYDINNNLSNPPVWKLHTYGDDILDCFYFGRKISKTKKGYQIDYSKTIQRVDIVKGSFFAVKLEDFIEVGGFDENTFLFCEERILAKKFLLKGKKLGIVTDAKYNHNHSESINRAYKKIYRQISILHNSKLYYYKTYTEISGLKILVLKICMAISKIEYAGRDFIKYAKNWFH